MDAAMLLKIGHTANTSTPAIQAPRPPAGGMEAVQAALVSGDIPDEIALFLTELAKHGDMAAATLREVADRFAGYPDKIDVALMRADAKRYFTSADLATLTGGR